MKKANEATVRDFEKPRRDTNTDCKEEIRREARLGSNRQRFGQKGRRITITYCKEETRREEIFEET